LDFFPKVADEIKIQTTFSAVVSLICASLLLILFTNELYYYLRTDVSTAVGVDATLPNQRLRINFDFTLPGLPCNDFGLDLVDTAGDQQLEIVENIQKQRTEKGKENELGAKGCNIHGFLETSKVRGEFHIAFGRRAEASSDGEGHQSSTEHIHRFSPSEIFTFNSTHTINRLSFGEDFPGVLQPLDGVTKLVQKGSGRFQYFIQVVPTIYTYTNGKRIFTNQYSVTENTVIVDPTARTFKQPGIFFKYELSSYTVRYDEQSKSFSHFLTQCCAIVGGVFVVIGMISSVAWYLDRYILGSAQPIRRF